MRTLIIAAALTLAATTAEAADPLTMAASARGSSLELTFTNVSTAPVTMTTHVRAGLDHHDALTVKLTGAATRTLHFTEARDKSVPVEATIAPGASISRSVDLAAWAIRGGNGAALAPGAYDVQAVWDARSPRVRLVATAKLVIAAAVEKPCTDTSSTGLSLLAYQPAAGGPIEVGLHNVDRVSHCVTAYIKTHEIQSDWLSLDLHSSSGKPRRIALDDARDKSFPVFVEIPPGATYWATWDLSAWARRKRNGATAIAKGTHWIDAVFDATRERDTWRGSIKESFGVKY